MIPAAILMLEKKLLNNEDFFDKVKMSKAAKHVW
jgi:hypothetical protein